MWISQIVIIDVPAIQLYICSREPKVHHPYSAIGNIEDGASATVGKTSTTISERYERIIKWSTGWNRHRYCAGALLLLPSFLQLLKLDPAKNGLCVNCVDNPLVS